jgi:hypothetical protein
MVKDELIKYVRSFKKTHDTFHGTIPEILRKPMKNFIIREDKEVSNDAHPE